MHPLLRVLVLAAAPPLLGQDLHLPLDAADATWHGAAAIADGAVGGAARFDGRSAAIDCGSCTVAADEALALRCALRTSQPGFGTLLMARDGDQVMLSLVIGREPGKLSFEAWNWQQVKLTSQNRVDDGAWHRVEVSYQPQRQLAILYVDGHLDAVASLGPCARHTAQLRLGDNIGVHQPYAGDLDDVHLEHHTSHAADFAWAAPVLPAATVEAALTAQRARLLPRATPSLAKDQLASWTQRRAAVRAFVADCCGLVPPPPKGPLDVQVHGEIKADGFTVQRVTWNSLPGTRASGFLWLPSPLPKTPAPAVLCPHGHWKEGTAEPVVQARCIAFAKFGWPCLSVDSVHVEDAASGVNAIGVMTWNNIRGLDLLCERKDVDTKHLGVTGASGGGQQTYYLMALEDRLAAAAPMVMACYFANMVADTDAHCTCNQLPRLGHGTDVPEMCAVFAPKPTLFGSVTGDWTHDWPEHGLPELRTLWSHLGADGYPRSRHANEGHNYDQPMREVVYGFLHDELVGKAADGQRRATVAEPDVHPLPVAQLRGLGGPAFRSAPDQHLLAAEFLQRRARVADIRQLAPLLPWQVSPAPIVWAGDETSAWRPGTVTGADGVPVPFVQARGGDVHDYTVVIGDNGRLALLQSPPAWLAAAPGAVLVDPRWLGEWQTYAPFWRRNGLLLGAGEGYQAAHDVALVCHSLPGKASITLVGLGAAGVTALLSAPLCPRITRIVADDLGPTFAADGNRLPMCPELCRFGDLDDLAKAAARSAKCTLGGFAGRAALTATDVGAAIAAH